MSNRVYISGKVSGLPQVEAFIKFGQCESWLKSKGYEVVNPTRLCGTDWGWSRSMRVCIVELLKCDTICMLDNWHVSRGAQLEWAIAHSLGMRIMNYRSSSKATDEREE